MATASGEGGDAAADGAQYTNDMSAAQGMHAVGKITLRNPGNSKVQGKGLWQAWELTMEFWTLEMRLNSWNGGTIEKTVGIQIRC